MALDVTSYALSKGFTSESLLGGGSVVGKNVTISSITPIEGGNRVTFSYTLDNGTVKTSTMDVMDGKDGKEPSITIGTNNNWFVNGVDTGVKAKGEKGDTGSGFNTTRQYSSVSDMMSDTNPANDSEIVVVVLGDVGNFYMRLSSYVDPDGITNGYLPIGSAQDISTIKGDPGKDGTDGITPHIDSATKHWFLGTNDTGVTAEGKDGTDGEDGVTPHIDSVTKHWMIGSQDTSIIAEGQDGKDGVDGTTPHIDETTKHWFIGDVDTGILSEGVSGNDGITPHIGTNGNWFIGDTDTGVLAHGTDGKDGKSIKSITKDENNNIITTFTDGTTENIGQLAIDVEADFLTETGFGKLRYYNGALQYYNDNTSSWIDTSITPDNVIVMNMTPKPMRNISLLYNRKTGYIEIKFTEPDDTYIDGQLLCAIEKIVLVRKKDSEPLSIDDGDKVLELKRNNFGAYSKYPFVDNSISPNIGDIYYYKAFPVSTMGYVNDFSQNSKMIEIKDKIIYGFKIDQNESDPASMITYLSDCENAKYASAYMDYTTNTFNYGDWADAWFIRDIKPCMLKYDGTVDYELNPNDYTKKLDGTDSDVANDSYGGNAMVGIPKVYWKIVDNGDNTANIYFSDEQVDTDFHCWSHIDNNGNEIDYCYMPIYTGSVVSNKLRSLSGKAPINNDNGTAEITYAKANNLTSDTIWYTEVFSDRMLINLLLLLIGKSTDTQTIFGNGHYAGGSSASSNIVAGTMNNKGLFYGTNGTGKGVKVFGMEHWWGNQFRRIAGWIIDNGTQKIKMTYGQSDGSTVDGYTTDGTGYIKIPNSTPSGSSSGYISKLSFGNYGYIPVISNGSQTTYYCDKLWYNNSQINYALVGGSSYEGYPVGLFASYINSAVSFANWNFTAALSCKPLATT